MMWIRREEEGEGGGGEGEEDINQVIPPHQWEHTAHQIISYPLHLGR